MTPDNYIRSGNNIPEGEGQPPTDVLNRNIAPILFSDESVLPFSPLLPHGPTLEAGTLSPSDVTISGDSSVGACGIPDTRQDGLSQPSGKERNGLTTDGGYQSNSMLIEKRTKSIDMLNEKNQVNDTPELRSKLALANEEREQAERPVINLSAELAIVQPECSRWTRGVKDLSGECKRYQQNNVKFNRWLGRLNEERWGEFIDSKTTDRCYENYNVYFKSQLEYMKEELGKHEEESKLLKSGLARVQSEGVRLERKVTRLRDECQRHQLNNEELKGQLERLKEEQRQYKKRENERERQGRVNNRLEKYCNNQVSINDELEKKYQRMEQGNQKLRANNVNSANSVKADSECHDSLMANEKYQCPICASRELMDPVNESTNNQELAGFIFQDVSNFIGHLKKHHDNNERKSLAESLVVWRRDDNRKNTLKNRTYSALDKRLCTLRDNENGVCGYISKCPGNLSIHKCSYRHRPAP
nr:hypothetical protein [Endozoicomonas sp.]